MFFCPVEIWDLTIFLTSKWKKEKQTNTPKKAGQLPALEPQTVCKTFMYHPTAALSQVTTVKPC